MGLTLEQYPPAPVVLAAYAAHLGRMTPTKARYVDAAFIARYWADTVPDGYGGTTEQHDRIVQLYLEVLDRQDWCVTVRAGLEANSALFAWFGDKVATRLRLRAFSDLAGGIDS